MDGWNGGLMPAVLTRQAREAGNAGIGGLMEANNIPVFQHSSIPSLQAHIPTFHFTENNLTKKSI
jgi:hypothetical protein